MIRALHHVSLSTPDLERAVAFYRDVLGFSERARAGWPAGTEDADAIVGLTGSAARIVALWAHNIHIELFEYTQPVPHGRPTDWRVCDHGFTHLCLDVTDIDGEYERLSARGMSFTAPPRTIFGVRATYGRDPDGNRIELQETLPGSELTLPEPIVVAAADRRTDTEHIVVAAADRRTDTDAVAAALLRGFWLVDHGRADEIAAGARADVVVSGLGPDPLDHAGLAAYGARRRANRDRHTRHVVTNVVIEPRGSDEMSSSCLLTVHALDAEGAAQVSFFGDVDDVYVRDGGSWLLRQRSLTPFTVTG